MRIKTVTAGAAALLALATLTPAASADEHRVDLGIFLGAHVFNDDNELGVYDVPDADSPGNALAGGVRAGYRISDMFSVEGELAVMPTSAREGNADLTVFGFRLQGLAHFAPADAKLRPFAMIGTSVMAVSSSDDDVISDDSDWVGLHGGGGLTYALNDKTGLRADARLFLPPSSANETVTVDFEVTVGVFRTFDLGVSTPAPPPAPVDSDGDGIVGAADKCPDQPEDKDGFEDDDGCPDDNDGDGIADAVDQCPNQAETMNGIEDTDGCPELDEDDDGIVGAADKCPKEPEDVDKFQDEDGCPDPDNDGDGIDDGVDQCPDEAETVNGFEDTDGCADTVPEQVAKFTGVIKGIQFATGKAALRRSSYQVLDEAAKVLTEFPNLKLEIQGHTDNQGKDEKNLVLSQARANIVKAYLVKKGIAPERLTAAGYGETTPIADNTTKAGRAENRRVEFKLIQ